ncbi:hypothetical protein EN780_04430 [Mesorhizobium sp. M4B.F.Ca.ET.089.01.1.1]|uniref:hypothetical protein n=1 Tax=Mesorhizobium sp. M4B.F.Ca.ET.089.01.1.1 TaxID=2496662 RepID=UPI000FE36DA8|nr:hypothetical protein [Mesorhizobium sp. M4B.F.Ca.ET.089.01.1.1]RWX70036.1 hypothetical protein EN780_04430 [Mesorhizobium sp. M4B.F.Ca.ET.089.01.1.1]
MNNEIKHSECPTYIADIFIGGDEAAARQACQEFVLEGECVNFAPCEYIFTGGREVGVRVGLINYPRFPRSPDEIFTKALRLAAFLIERLHQSSASIVASDRTVFLSRRPE